MPVCFAEDKNGAGLGVWVYGPKVYGPLDARATIYLSKDEPLLQEDDPREHRDDLPHEKLTARACRRLAYLLVQAADMIDDEFVKLTDVGYERQVSNAKS